MRLNRDSTALLVVDIQKLLAPAMHQAESAIQANSALIQAARHLNIPIFASEHCAEKIGPTVADLRALLRDDEILHKRHFSCVDDAEILQALHRLGKRQIVVTGMEAHVCVLQTVMGLIEHGFKPFFVADAVASRHFQNKELAKHRLRQHGVPVISTEMALFEWMGHADHPLFRDILRLVKSL
jgi:nicotinamidase-related amidase